MSGVSSTTAAGRTQGTGPEPSGPRVDRVASSIRFVYPFTFDGDSFAQRAEVVASSEASIGKARRHLWAQQSFQTDDMLAQVAAFVDPPAGAPVSARLWRIDEDVLRSPSGLGAGRTHAGADWILSTRQGKIPFVIESVELALFEHGVGFLTIAALPESPNLDEWFTFIHFFRYVSGKRASYVSATRLTGNDGVAGERATVAYFPPLAAGGVFSDADHPAHNFGTIIDGLLATGATSADMGPWWSEIFVPGVLLPYTALFVDSLPPADVAGVLYRLRNFFHAKQVIHGSDHGLDGARLLPYATDQWFFSSLNGGGFLGCNAPETPFFRVTLPGHIRAQYFLLFLLALEQRFVLMRLSQSVAERWTAPGAERSESTRAAAFADIRQRLLAFTAQGYFAQTMQEEHHHRSYVHWRDAFQLARLYETVAAEVREMHSFLEQRQREHAEAAELAREARSKDLDRRLSVVTWLLGIPVSLLLVINASTNIAVVRHLISGPQSPATVQGYDLLIGVIIDLAGIAIGYLTYRVLNRRARRLEHVQHGERVE